MDINNPIPEAWTSYVTQTNLGLEIVPAPLFSVKNYVSGVTRELSFFDFVNGSRPDLTNMKQPSMLPNPESFLIQNIRVFNWAQPQSDDSGEGDCAGLTSQFGAWVEMTRRGILTMKIGNKVYGPWPLWMLSAANFVKGAFSTGSDLLADYGQLDGPLYPLLPNLCLSPLQQFEVKLSWPGSSSDEIPGGPVEFCGLDCGGDDEDPCTMPIQILFDGQLARSIQ